MMFMAVIFCAKRFAKRKFSLKAQMRADSTCSVHASLAHIDRLCLTIAAFPAMFLKMPPKYLISPPLRKFAEDGT
jgi:hypothetical protein